MRRDRSREYDRWRSQFLDSNYAAATKKTFGELQVLGKVDVTEVQRLLKARCDLWLLDTWRQSTYRVHKNTENIILKWVTPYKNNPVKENQELLSMFKPFIDAVVKIVTEALQLKNPKIYKLCFVKLLAHSNVKRHEDMGLGLRIVHRVHIPIFTNSNVDTEIGEQTFYLREGNIYNFNNTLPHSISNNSDADRVHCILDIQNEKEYNNNILKFTKDDNFS